LVHSPRHVTGEGDSMRLGDLERRVMDVLWVDFDSELTGREVAQQLPGYAYTTVLTVLTRLERKGLVRHERTGPLHRFAATGSRETYIATLMNDALNVSSDRGASLARFAETVSPEEAEMLRRALDTATPPGKRHS